MVWNTKKNKKQDQVCNIATRITLLKRENEKYV